ncbi:hypothetical protein DFH08DRAFT_1043118 [Mycena albidolilacea]|uniref:Uncharacterized protein n=1 Tax=Mycena albidolilacea TaxID=1033008 RepID=A0AAD7AGL7_9AGAR|nr:hypothetical protein DFH08DRAFT_1043118 [Mycena albidolilacea]
MAYLSDSFQDASILKTALSSLAEDIRVYIPEGRWECLKSQDASTTPQDADLPYAFHPIQTLGLHVFWVQRLSQLELSSDPDYSGTTAIKHDGMGGTNRTNVVRAWQHAWELRTPFTSPSHNLFMPRKPTTQRSINTVNRSLICYALFGLTRYAVSSLPRILSPSRLWALLPAAAFLWIAKGFIYYVLAPTAFVGAIIALSSVVRDVRRWCTPAPTAAALEGGTADPLQVSTSISPPSSSPELGHNLLLLLLSTLFFLGCITAFGETTIFEMTVRRIVGASPIRWARRVAWLVVFTLYRRGSGWVHETYIPQVGWNVELEPDLPAATAKVDLGDGKIVAQGLGNEEEANILRNEKITGTFQRAFFWGMELYPFLGCKTPLSDQLVRIPLRNSLVEEFPETFGINQIKKFAWVYSQYSGYHPGRVVATRQSLPH